MKRIVISLLTLFFVITLYAGNSVSMGANADLYAYKFAGETYIVMSFKDDDENRLIDNSTLRLQLFDNTILELNGNDQSKKTKTNSVNWGFGISSGSSSDKHYAVFVITSDQIGKLKQGVKKIALNTIPVVYIREYKKDQIGAKLYDMFSSLTDEF